MKGEELKRIDKNNNGETPKEPKIIIRATNVKNAKEVLKNTKEIMKSISQFAYTNQWPSDEEWKSLLPGWFVESMTSKTTEDRDKDDNLWHYESWIDNIRQRVWLWYSSKIEKDTLEFVLEVVSYPYLHYTFIYILYSQGIPMDNISVTEDNISE